MCPAYFDTGFSVREPMWHGEGVVLDDYPTDWADAREKAGLLWEPEERPAFNRRPVDAFRVEGRFVCRVCGAVVADSHHETCSILSDHSYVVIDDAVPEGSTVIADTAFVPVPDHKLIVRNDNELVLGVTSDQYSLIYHGANETVDERRASMAQILESFEKEGAKFETAGSCREGRQVWALLYLDEPFVVPGETGESIPFVALLNTHDGTGACKLTRTMVRVVCWNTYQMASAEGDRTGLQFTFRHTGNVESRIEEARAALNGLRQDARDYVALAEELMTLKVDDEALGRVPVRVPAVAA